MADPSAIPAFVASDLLSQAEHGPDSQVILVCPSLDIADKVEAEIAVQLERLPRKEVAVRALENSRVILITSAAQGLYLTPHLLGPHDLGGPPGAQLLRGQPSTLPAPGLRWGEETQPGAQPWILSRVGVAGQGSLN